MSSDKYLVDSNTDADTGGKMETFLNIREVLDKGAMQTFLTDYCEVSHTDWGVYRCRARNTMGMGEAIVMLKSKFRGWQGF